MVLKWRSCELGCGDIVATMALVLYCFLECWFFHFFFLFFVGYGKLGWDGEGMGM